VARTFPAAICILGVAAGLTLAFVAKPAFACSTCLCGSPTPPGLLLRDGEGPWQLGLEDRYLGKTAGIEGGGEELHTEHRLAILGSLRPTPRLLLQGRLPYVWKRSEISLPAAGRVGPALHPGHDQAAESRTTSGLGDPELTARFDLRPMAPEGSLSLSLLAATTFPLGATGTTAGDYDPHLEPGAGAFSGTLGFGADLRAFHGIVAASIAGRLNGTNAEHFHYGNTLLANAAYARLATSSLELSCELNARVADYDEEGSERDPNSGGFVLYLSPGLHWSGLGPFAADLAFQLPVATDLNGVQDEHPTARAAMSFTGR
jgi:hypothetical protein